MAEEIEDLKRKDAVKPDAGSQREEDGVEVPEGEEPFAGGAGEGDDLPTSGLR